MSFRVTKKCYCCNKKNVFRFSVSNIEYAICFDCINLINKSVSTLKLIEAYENLDLDYTKL